MANIQVSRESWPSENGFGLPAPRLLRQAAILDYPEPYLVLSWPIFQSPWARRSSTNCTVHHYGTGQLGEYIQLGKKIRISYSIASGAQLGTLVRQDAALGCQESNLALPCIILRHSRIQYKILTKARENLGALRMLCTCQCAMGDLSGATAQGPQAGSTRKLELSCHCSYLTELPGTGPRPGGA
eukprot:3142959-Rhodomonas_salina.2